MAVRSMESWSPSSSETLKRSTAGTSSMGIVLMTSCKGTFRSPSYSSSDSSVHFRPLPIASAATRCLPISVTSSVVFLTEPTTEELPTNFRPAVRLPLILFLFILFLFSLWRDLITPPVIIFLIAPLLFIYYFIVRLRYI